MNLYDRLEWEQISRDGTTHRLKVFGGWIIRTRTDRRYLSEALVFVPDPTHQWEKEDGRES